MSLDNQTKKILENLTRAVSRIEKTVHGNAFNSLDIVSEHHHLRKNTHFYVV